MITNKQDPSFDMQYNQIFNHILGIYSKFNEIPSFMNNEAYLKTQREMTLLMNTKNLSNYYERMKKGQI